VFGWKESGFLGKLFSVENIFQEKLIFVSHFSLFGTRQIIFHEKEKNVN